MDDKYIEETEVTLSEEVLDAPEPAAEPVVEVAAPAPKEKKEKKEASSPKGLEAGVKVRFLSRKDASGKLLGRWTQGAIFYTADAEAKNAVAISPNGKAPVTAYVKTSDLEKV